MRLVAPLPLAWLSVVACVAPAPPRGRPARAEPPPLTAPSAAPAAPRSAGPCPVGMALVTAPEPFCVDRWEAHLVEVLDSGEERAHSPFELVGAKRVRARSAPGVFPQGYISQEESARACAVAGKRLCTQREFVFACRGASDDWYPYGGRSREADTCNDDRFSAVTKLFGPNSNAWSYENFNDPRLNQLEGGLAKTGAHPRCVSRFGVYDLVGNLHEWIDAPIDPRTNHTQFVGGSYGDAEKNGPGCLYVTSMHEAKYHDHSTGFRCCRAAVD